LIGRYDFVLIDSRTGVSDMSGICTIEMPEKLVGCFTLNRQSIAGAAATLGSIKAQRNGNGDRAKIALFPVAMRIESAEHIKLQLALQEARRAFGPFLPEDAIEEPLKYWNDMEVTYHPFYAFEEVLAVFGDLTGAAGSKRTLLREIELLTRRITGREKLEAPEVEPGRRQEVLDKYAFGPLSAREKDQPRYSDETEILRNLCNKERLWSSRGNRYLYLLSKHELGLVSAEDVRKFGPRMRSYFDASIAMSDIRKTATRDFLIFWGFMLPFVIAFLTLSLRNLEIIKTKRQAAMRLVETL
jgi:hypothetical protein